MLQSRYRRAGSPVLLAFGPKLEKERLRVGMLFVSAQLDQRDYELYDPESGEAVKVRLPAGLLDLSTDAMRANVGVEVIG